ncbi:MAG: Ppx/GppA family phosphatase [Planctomycetes bacterium]|nr:Ppx/GppA family phosphatase [Planctomycetota bacterium]
MHKLAVIDLGTNSVKLLIAKVNPPPHFRIVPLYERVVITRIGRNLKTTQRLDKSGSNKTLQLIKGFTRQCRKKNISDIFILGTNALREAKDSAEFIHELKRETGLRIKVVSGREEAYFSYLGAVDSLRKEKNLVIDIGGGSTELVYGIGPKVKWWKSIPMGAVKLTELCVHSDPILKSDYDKLLKQIKRRLPAKATPKPVNCYGVGGTVVTLAAVAKKLKKLTPGKIEGYLLTRNKVTELLKLLCRMNITQRMEINGIEKERADIIPAGTAILSAIMDLWNIKTIKVSSRGLRYGFIKNNALIKPKD